MKSKIRKKYTKTILKTQPTLVICPYFLSYSCPFIIIVCMEIFDQGHLHPLLGHPRQTRTALGCTVVRTAQCVIYSLHGKTVPSHRGHHYGETWPRSSSSSTGAPELSSKELFEQLVNSYSEHLHEAFTILFKTACYLYLTFSWRPLDPILLIFQELQQRVVVGKFRGGRQLGDEWLSW